MQYVWLEILFFFVLADSPSKKSWDYFFFDVSENKLVTAVLLRVTACNQSLWQLEVLLYTATK